MRYSLLVRGLSRGWFELCPTSLSGTSLGTALASCGAAKERSQKNPRCALNSPYGWSCPLTLQSFKAQYPSSQRLTGEFLGARRAYYWRSVQKSTISGLSYRFKPSAISTLACQTLSSLCLLASPEHSSLVLEVPYWEKFPLVSRYP